MKRLSLFALLSVLLFVPSVRAEPSLDQQVRFQRLSPAEATEMFRAYDEAQRLKHWDTVTELKAVAFVRTNDVRDLDYERNLGWDNEVPRHEKVKVWCALETPRKAAVPIDVQIVWYLDGKQFRLKTASITSPSPNYRTWDVEKMDRPGTWTVQIVAEGRVLARGSYVVR